MVSLPNRFQSGAFPSRLRSVHSVAPLEKIQQLVDTVAVQMAVTADMAVVVVQIEVGQIAVVAVQMVDVPEQRVAVQMAVVVYMAVEQMVAV